MMRLIILGVAASFAVLAPLLPRPAASPTPPRAWPARFDGHPISRMKPAASDQVFTRGFPGHVARFSDGRRQIVLRQVNTATRQLHPARDCFSAIGYGLSYTKIEAAPDGKPRACFTANRGADRLKVCEEIRDSQGSSYSEVSAWYWPALLGQSQGPWIAATIVERVAE